MMNASKVCSTWLWVVVTLYTFLSPPIVRGMGDEYLRDERCRELDLDYDTAGTRKTATVSGYLPARAASDDSDDPQLSNGKVEPGSGDSSTLF